MGQKVKIISKIVIFRDFRQCTWHRIWRPKVTRVKVKVHRIKVKGRKGQGQLRVPNTGRWAHINIKLLH